MLQLLLGLLCAVMAGLNIQGMQNGYSLSWFAFVFCLGCAVVNFILATKTL